MRGRSKWLAGLIGVVVLLTGCGGSPAAKPDAKPDPNKPVELNIWGGYPELDPLYQRVGEEYKKLHPNVTVKVLSMNLRDFEKKLAAALPSDSAGDIMARDVAFMSQFIDAGLIAEAPEDVVQLVKGGAYDKYTLDHSIYKDKVYAVGLFKGQSGIYYNTDYFKAAGIDKPPATMDELIEDAKKLAQRDAGGNLTRAGISLRLSGGGSGVAEKFWTLMEQSGASIIAQSKSGKWHNGYDNDGARKTLQMYVDLVHKFHADDPKLKHDAEAFELGLAAMFVRESWVVGDIEKKAPNLHYATARMPSAAISGGEMLFVSKASKNQAVAWDFIKFLVNAEHQKQLLDEIGWLPLRKDVDYADVIKKHPGFAGFIVSDPNYRLFTAPLLNEWDEIETKMAGKLEKAFADASLVDNPSGIAKAIKAMADETDAILKANNHYGTD